MSLEDTKMHMSNESLLIILGVGLIAGWLAGQIVQGTGFGIVGDLIIGIVGAFIGSWLLPHWPHRIGLRRELPPGDRSRPASRGLASPLAADAFVGEDARGVLGAVCADSRQYGL
jgi:uncharacterized membrane protein YeaQ/YmgE (transglycosylase-associated protein family)